MAPRNRFNAQRLISFILAVALIVLAQLSLPVSGYAAADKVVRLGAYESKGMFEGASAEGIKRGYCYEYMMQVAVYTGWKYEFVYGSFGELYDKLKNGEIDILPYTNYNEQRGREVLFPAGGLVDEEYYIVGRPPKGAPTGTAVTLRNDSVISTIKGADFNSMLEAYIKKSGLDIKIKYYPEINECWDALRNGEADATIFTSITFSDDAWTTIASIGKKPTYVAVSRQKPQLLTELNEATELLTKENPAFLGDLYTEYFSQNPMRRNLTQEEKDWIARHPVLHIGCLADEAPYFVSDGEDGRKAHGLFIDVVNGIVNRLHLGTKAVFKGYDSLEKMEAALDSGEIDAIVPFYRDYYVAQHHNLIFSNTLREANMGLVYRKGTSLTDAMASIATPFNRLGVFYVRENFPDSRVVEATGVGDAVEKVHAGKAAGAVALGVALQNAKEKYDDLNFLVLRKGCEVGFATRPENYPLIRILNRGLMYFSNGEMSALAAKHMPQPQVTASAFLASHKTAATAVGFAVVLALLYAWFRSKRASEREKAQQDIVENNNRVMALEDNFESLYDVELATGKYSVFIKGETYDREIKDKLLAINEYFSDLRKNIDMVVYPEDRARLQYVLGREGMVEELADRDHFDHYYRVMADNKPVWFKVRIVYKNAEKKNVIIGVFNAEAEVAARQKDEEQRNELINQMVGENAVLIVDCVNDTRKTVRDSYYGTVYSDENSYSHEMNRYIDTMVDAAERELLRELSAPQYMLEHTENNKEFSHRYLTVADGVPCYYEMQVRRLSETEVLQSFTNVDDAVAYRMVREAISENCYGIFLVNLDNDMVKAVKHSAAFAIDTSHKTYAAIAGLYIEGLGEKARHSWKGLDTLAGVKEFLRNEDKREFVYASSYRGNRLDRVTWYVVNRVGGEASTVCVAFAGLDEEQADREKLNEQIAEQKNRLEEALAATQAANKKISEQGIFTGYFLQPYQSAYYIGLDDLSFQVYRRTEDLERDYPVIPDYLESLGDYINNEVHPDDRERTAAILLKPQRLKELLAEKPELTLNYRIIADGKERIVQATVIRGADESHAAFGFKDITDVVREQEEKQQSLEKALRMAEAANNAKSTFLFNMSHDIRTPMNAITGFTAMAKKYLGDKEKTADYLNKIDASGKQLLSLVNQVLEMARIESGKIVFENAPVNIKDRFDTMVTILQEQAEVNGLEFRHSLKNITHYNILADDARMSQITLNITGNAMKYTHEGGTVEFDLEEKPCDREGFARYTFTVADTGIGMSKEFLKVLFEPFAREKTSTVSHIQGTGLGLSIVKNLVDLAGGTIEVESELGKGSRFDITLDFRIDEQVQAEDKAAAENAVEKHHLVGKKVLLVEDNELNCEIAKDVLEELGFDVEEADDGDVAVQLVSGKGVSYYDCVLMDIQMPRMNGYEATREIRKLPGAGKLPIIALSANAFEEDKRKSLEAGMNDHVAKPIDVGVLVATLTRFL